MSPFETASIVLSGIQALSAVISTARGGPELLVESAPPETPDLIDKRVFRTDSADEEITDFAGALTEVADPEILDIINENIERATKRLKKSLADPSLPQSGKDQELEVADSVICNELERMKKLNGGSLPQNQEIIKIWKQHRCDSAS